ncbi:MAG: cysteine desulfurase-like protein [Roseiflexus sp.]|jgi:cysteine desulfurase family protein (TIGR01976 family)|nr:cysteine desulfurase-like protein [Roseiflexus sp.]MBO9334181.1 cysteine desulfurase-like protein [Roseiflexus sp.]MBO9365800.1 cysteine desulfurase-like protein [Roseiflexus sp.]MBO9381999.1 cysteine desulfurase-like protein [Roseiflexus sp.]MBO9389399.1 cysteine desulfurase-like protein [Roseiflexus sp.]
MHPLDLTWIRAQFPALAQEVNGHPAVFFDGPGGTQVPQRVIDAVADYLTYHNANTHGAFATSRRTDETIDAARAAMADFLGCAADEVVFGPNMTTLTFAISRAFGRDIRPGDEIVLTRLDHDANVAPWKALEERGAVIRMVDIDTEECTLDMADMARAIGPRTRLVAVGYASNAVGTINDVATITRMAHAVGALVYIDAVHYAPHGPIDVRALDCDFLACSPYKFFAPHMGALYGKREHLARLRPYKVRPASDDIPDRWETGTKNHAGLAGVTAAIEYLAELGQRIKPATTRRTALVQAMEAIKAYERGLSERLIAGLLAIPGLTFYGISDPARFDMRTPTAAVRLAGRTPRELAEALGRRGIFCWDGNYYAINLTERLGVEADGGMLRIGLVHYNTVEEIELLLESLNELRTGK